MSVFRLSIMILVPALIISPVIHAAPATCPGVEAIQAAGIQAIKKIRSREWLAGAEYQRYDTQDSWTFKITKIIAYSEDAARTIAEESLQTLTFVRGPIDMDELGWYCMYQSDNDHVSVAITPAGELFQGQV